MPKTKQTTAVAGVRVREGCETGSKQERRCLGIMECCAEVRRSNRNEMREGWGVSEVRDEVGTKLYSVMASVHDFK